MAAVDLSKLVKEKRFWVASFLVVWAAALQVGAEQGRGFPHGCHRLDPEASIPLRLPLRIQMNSFLAVSGPHDVDAAPGRLQAQVRP